MYHESGAEMRRDSESRPRPRVAPEADDDKPPGGRKQGDNDAALADSKLEGHEKATAGDGGALAKILETGSEPGGHARSESSLSNTTEDSFAPRQSVRSLHCIPFGIPLLTCKLGFGGVAQPAGPSIRRCMDAESSRTKCVIDWMGWWHHQYCLCCTFVRSTPKHGRRKYALAHLCGARLLQSTPGGPCVCAITEQAKC